MPASTSAAHTMRHPPLFLRRPKHRFLRAALAAVAAVDREG
jgi:hypothetical protein